MLANALRKQLQFGILPQPDEITCGPTCLHALYGYYGDELPLDQVIAGVPMLEGGGTAGPATAARSRPGAVAGAPPGSLPGDLSLSG